MSHEAPEKQVPRYGIYHHSADPDPGNQLDKINRYHKERGFPQSSRGFFVGYHYLISQQGFQFCVRDRNEVGAHDQGENYGTVGVCFMNDFSVNRPNEAEEYAMADLVEESITFWGWKLTDWEPHRKNDTTECPGKNIPDNWAQLCYLKYKLTWLQRILAWLKHGI